MDLLGIPSEDFLVWDSSQDPGSGLSRIFAKNEEAGLGSLQESPGVDLL